LLFRSTPTPLARSRRGGGWSSLQTHRLQQLPSIVPEGLWERQHRRPKRIHPLSERRGGRRVYRAPFRSVSLRQSIGSLHLDQALVQAPVALLDVGLANAPPNLVRTGGPPLATVRGNSTVAWLWAINVDQGSRFRIKLVGPGETTLIDHTTNALPRRKANYLAYVGRKVGVRQGHIT
jgi:hypothetical protein